MGGIGSTESSGLNGCGWRKPPLVFGRSMTTVGCSSASSSYSSWRLGLRDGEPGEPDTGAVGFMGDLGGLGGGDMEGVLPRSWSCDRIRLISRRDPLGGTAWLWRFKAGREKKAPESLYASGWKRRLDPSVGLVTLGALVGPVARIVSCSGPSCAWATLSRCV